MSHSSSETENELLLLADNGFGTCVKKKKKKAKEKRNTFELTNTPAVLDLSVVSFHFCTDMLFSTAEIGRCYKLAARRRKRKKQTKTEDIPHTAKSSARRLSCKCKSITGHRNNYQ